MTLIRALQGCEVLWSACLYGRTSARISPNFTKFSVHVTLAVTRYSSDDHQCVIYFRFCGWRHTFTYWIQICLPTFLAFLFAHNVRIAQCRNPEYRIKRLNGSGQAGSRCRVDSYGLHLQKTGIKRGSGGAAPKWTGWRAKFSSVLHTQF